MIESFLPSSILSFYAEIALMQGGYPWFLGAGTQSHKSHPRRSDEEDVYAEKEIELAQHFSGTRNRRTRVPIYLTAFASSPVPFIIASWLCEEPSLTRLDGRTHFHAERIVRTLSTMDEKGCSSHFLPFLNGIQARLWCLRQPSIFISFQSHCIVCSLLKPALTYAKFHRFTRYIHETYGEKNARAYTDAVIHYQTKLRQSFELQPAGTYKI